MAFDQTKPADNTALNSVDVRNNFVHLKSAISKEHGWDDATPNNTAHRLDQISATVTASTQRDPITGYDYTTGSGTIATLINHTELGITANTYTLQALLQELVNRSHRHTVERKLSNCNCDCGGA